MINKYKFIKNSKIHENAKFENLRKNLLILIANCSAHRLPTEMSLYFLESLGQGDSKKYRLISVGGL